MIHPEAFSRVLIDDALRYSSWKRVQAARALQVAQAKSAQRIEVLYHSMLPRAFAGEL